MKNKNEIDEATRQQLRQKRQELGFSYRDMACSMGVDWTTYRRWEMGAVNMCSARNWNAMQSFLANGSQELERSQRLRKDFNELLGKLEKVQGLIADNKTVLHDFRQGMERLVSSVFQRYLSGDYAER